LEDVTQNKVARLGRTVSNSEPIEAMGVDSECQMCGVVGEKSGSHHPTSTIRVVLIG
jgi:hypothetical protein